MSNCQGGAVALPSWVPQSVRHYLAHTEAGMPIRELARLAGVHASTVLRQVRRLESRRDDPLVDSGLRGLADLCSSRQLTSLQGQAALAFLGQSSFGGSRKSDDEARKLNDEAMRLLRRLAEVGAVLAMARDMDKGVIVREGQDGVPQRLAVVDRSTAEAMAVQEWMSCADCEARINRYHITSAGRTALKSHMAKEENLAQGFSERIEVFDGLPVKGGQGRPRVSVFDSPLSGLARRRDRDGKPFLGRDLVVAGERLREDFELSQLELDNTADWSHVLLGADPPAPRKASAAYDRVTSALKDLGPGLGDVALRACCYLEGMETLEKRMGWSARSGKIVLRIALQRLHRHYADINGGLGPMIG